MSYIQFFDFAEGTRSVNPFLESYIPKISSGLNYMTQFLFIENEEIFQAAVDFWLWFSYKVFTLRGPNDTLDTFDLVFENNNNNNFGVNNNINFNNSGIHVKYTKDQYLQYYIKKYFTNIIRD